MTNEMHNSDTVAQKPDLNDQHLSSCIRTIRHFNRLYAARLGVLNEKVFGTDLSLTEIRVVQELKEQGATTATFLSKNLSLDCGYLSRILNRFEKDGLVVKERSLKDARQRTLSLTKKGLNLAADISDSADRSVYEILKPLDRNQHAKMIDAMSSILALLGVNAAP